MATTKKSSQQQQKNDFTAQNWKHLSPKELDKLSLIERSRYFAYEPSRHSTSIKTAQQRVHQQLAIKLEQLNQNNWVRQQARDNLQRNYQLGQIKAAEAKTRTRELRDTYHANRASEIKHLVSTQQSALKAARLQSLLPCANGQKKLADVMSKKLRMRVEELMEDELGAATGRILC